MRLEGELIFPDAIAARLDEWQIPTELVRDPIIGFTAVRGVAGLLAQGFAALGLPADSAPNQLFVWVGAAFPVQILAAAPTPAAEKVLQSAAAVLPARFNAALRAADAGALELLTNAAGEVALRWTDIPPFITPFLTVAAGSNQTHLVAGLYPNWAVPDSPAPTALFEHLARGTNLVFYDWEFTGPRSYAWRAGWNVPRHILHKPRLSADTASIAFLNSLTNHPGNTVTEVRLTDTNRLTLVREGPFAFAAAELVWLAHWLESPDFPFRRRNPSRNLSRTPHSAGDGVARTPGATFLPPRCARRARSPARHARTFRGLSHERLGLCSGHAFAGQIRSAVCRGAPRHSGRRQLAGARLPRRGRDSVFRRARRRSARLGCGRQRLH